MIPVPSGRSHQLYPKVAHKVDQELRGDEPVPAGCISISFQGSLVTA